MFRNLKHIKFFLKNFYYFVPNDTFVERNLQCYQAIQKMIIIDKFGDYTSEKFTSSDSLIIRYQLL